MKRNRQFVESCDCCQVQFESRASFMRHCKSLGHKHKELGAQNAAVMADAENWENDDYCASIPMVMPHICPAQPQMPQPTVFENLSEVHEESHSETWSAISDNDASAHLPSEELEFFPFPDGKFFLLYCYAHGIMRPKVSTKYRVF